MPLLETSETIGSKNEAIDPIDALYHCLVRTMRMLILPADASSPLDELPVSQIRCLNTIGNDEGRKMQEIAMQLNIKLPAMSQMVERLVKKGLVERRDDAFDRRVVRLYLTPEATQMIDGARQIRMQHFRQAAMLLTPVQIVRMTEDLMNLSEVGEKTRRLVKEGELTSPTNDGAIVQENHTPLVEMLTEPVRKSRS